VSSINFHTKEISVKIVYYGPGLCGKTTTLQMIYNSLPTGRRPQLVSLSTEVDRTIFFDFLPVTAYRIRDFTVRLQLYTVPGQVFYNATRKLVLNGVDGLVFVADSQRAMKDSNLESLQNLEDNLNELGLEIAHVPMVMQFNKRDLTEIFAIEEMDLLYNPRHVPVFATVATAGDGIMETLKTVSQIVVNDLVRKGVGKQIRETSPVPSLSGAPTSAGPMAEAVRGATQPAHPPVSGDELWPAGEISRWGERIEFARAHRNWSDLVLAVDQLLQIEARRWAAAVHDTSPDPVPAFLLSRGTSPTRFNTFREALFEARAGRAVLQAAGMSAFILALEAAW
jgi:signal recognition particle receptor subunit beta